MSYVFISYKVTHKAMTGGNKTEVEGYLTMRPSKNSNSTEDVFRHLLDVIADKHSVSIDAVRVMNFNVMPGTVD